MKICEFTQYDLRAQEDEALKRAGRGAIITLPSPTERACQLLLLALKTVNQAGLDGKELSDLTLVTRYEAGRHADDQPIEIHAKVKHRLPPPSASKDDDKNILPSHYLPRSSMRGDGSLSSDNASP